MEIRETYKKFLDIPFPNDLSDNECLVDILFDLRMYDDYVNGSIDKYLSKKKYDNVDLRYDVELESLLIEFINNDNNTTEDRSAANLYLKYLKKIKAMLASLDV